MPHTLAKALKLDRDFNNGFGDLVQSTVEGRELGSKTGYVGVSLIHRGF